MSPLHHGHGLNIPDSSDPLRRSLCGSPSGPERGLMRSIIDTLSKRESYLTTSELMDILQVRRNTICDLGSGRPCCRDPSWQQLPLRPAPHLLLLGRQSIGGRHTGAQKNALDIRKSIIPVSKTR